MPIQDLARAASLILVELGLGIPRRGFVPTKRGAICPVRVDPHHWFAEIALLEQRDGACNAEPRPHFRGEAICEGSLALDVEARVELDQTFLGRDGLNETGICRREQIDVNIVANIERRAYRGHLALEPGLNKIVAE